MNDKPQDNPPGEPEPEPEPFGPDIERSVHHGLAGLDEEIERSVRAGLEGLHEGLAGLKAGLKGFAYDMDEPWDEVDETMLSDEVERQFEVDANPELTITSISGEIRIYGDEGNTIRVRAKKRGSRKRMAGTRIDFSQVGNHVKVTTMSSPGGILGFTKSVSPVDFSITVPRGCVVRAQTVSGDMTIRGTGGPLTLQTVSGDADVEGVRSELNLTTVSGDVTIRRLVGALIARSTSGDVTIRDSQLERCNVNSVSGDFSIETPLSVGEHYFAKTVSGDLGLLVPPDTGASVQLKTVSGDVVTHLPAEIIKAGRRHWQGRINGGGATVEMHSVSGDLTLSPTGGKSTAWTPKPPRPPVAPIPPAPLDPHGDRPFAPESSSSRPDEAAAHTGDQTAAILRRLEQGEITVEQAMALLDALS